MSYRWSRGPVLVTGWGSQRWVWKTGWWTADLMVYLGKTRPKD